MEVCVYDTGLIPKHSCEKLTELTWTVRISRFTYKNHELADAGKFDVQFFLCALLPYIILLTFSGGFVLLSAPELLLWTANFKNQVTMFVLWPRNAHWVNEYRFNLGSCSFSLLNPLVRNQFDPEINLTMSSFNY